MKQSQKSSNSKQLMSITSIHKLCSPALLASCLHPRLDLSSCTHSENSWLVVIYTSFFTTASSPILSPSLSSHHLPLSSFYKEPGWLDHCNVAPNCRGKSSLAVASSQQEHLDLAVLYSEYSTCPKRIWNASVEHCYQHKVNSSKQVAGRRKMDCLRLAVCSDINQPC